MASSGLAELVSLSLKARELHNKSHFERCVEKQRSALAVAEGLGGEDCVLVAVIKAQLVRAIVNRELLQDNFPLSQAIVLELLDLLTSSAASLRRRRDADTLMEGKCRSVEVQWSFKFLELGAGPVENAAGRAAQKHLIRAYSMLVGYDAFLELCCSAGSALCLAMVSGAFEHGGQTARAFLSLVCDLCDEAVELMVQPRAERCGTCVESVLPSRLQKLVAA